MDQNRDRYPDTLWPEPSEFHTIDLGWVEIDCGKHPLIAKINLLAGALLEIIGPMFWAALILLTLWAELSPG
jgi:hypothetical protein